MKPLKSEYALSGKTKTSHFQTKLSDLEKERQLKEEHKNGRNERDFSNQDFHIFLYNQAVVSFHQRLFNNALDILVKLKENTPENKVSIFYILSRALPFILGESIKGKARERM